MEDRRDRGNRNSSMKQERRRRKSLKSNETTSQKTSPKGYRRTTPSSISQTIIIDLGRTIERKYNPAINQRDDPISRYEGTPTQYIWTQLPEGFRSNKSKVRESARTGHLPNTIGLPNQSPNEDPSRDTSNNPIIQLVPIRPRLPVPPVTATQAQFVAFASNDANEQQAWDLPAR